MEEMPRPAGAHLAASEVRAILSPAVVVVHGTEEDALGAGGVLVTGLELASAKVRPGDMFAALPGHVTHGAAYCQDALDRGAAAILTDAPGVQMMDPGLRRRVTVIEVESPRSHLGALASAVYGHPSRQLTLMGITGTNGKTTVAAMVEAGLRAAGRITGIIGTVGIRFAGTSLPAARTTPEAPHLHAMLGTMLQAGVDSVAIEVSSHALDEGRVDGLIFDVAGFTNLSQDHLDYHGTMEDYFRAKADLFTTKRCKRAVIGIDDEWGRRLAAMSDVPLSTWSMREQGAADWTMAAFGDQWVVHGPAGERQILEVALPGDFNRANALCAFAMLRAAGIAPELAAHGIATVHVAGRMERVSSDGPVAGIIDYAHSPDAIDGAIRSAREATAGRVVVVIGAGGDRDRSKRPLMGRAAALLADVLIVTDDNPRSEDPASIRRAVLEGAHEAGTTCIVEHVPERREAIIRAVEVARPGDTVLVLGKGHELGQEVAGTVHPFDDRAELARALGVTSVGAAEGSGGRP